MSLWKDCDLKEKYIHTLLKPNSLPTNLITNILYNSLRKCKVLGTNVLYAVISNAEYRIDSGDRWGETEAGRHLC